MCTDTDLVCPFSPEDLEDIESSIGYKFLDQTKVINAFTRRSFWHENRSTCSDNNERMEFLGDSVLNMIIAHILYMKFPGAYEGELQKRRASLVKQNSLAIIMRNLGLAKFIRMGKGDERSGCRERSSILADTLEAIIGSVFLDGGYEEAAKFIHTHFRTMLDSLNDLACFEDSKSLLQERSQALFGITPVYAVLNEIGEEHSRIFTMGVFLGRTLVASGEGPNKKDAAQVAAARALASDDWESI
ncbi:MAG: ribonuclease III [Pseudomonadota bacterium]